MNDLLDDVLGYALDQEQRQVVYSKDKYILTIAGAGSGKSLTIIGKIRYLIEHDNILPSEILCISFTRESATSLKNKLLDYYKYDLDIYTFHKLALEIIKENMKEPITIAPSDFLEYTMEEYFQSIILENEYALKLVLKYFGIHNTKNPTEKYLKLTNSNTQEFTSLKKLLAQFLKLFKGQAYETSKFYEFYLINQKKYWFKTKRKNALFLQIAFSIYTLYENELQSHQKIDFDDMINNATEIVKKHFFKKYKYIIIDEYQDTSYTRFLLINEILKKTNANLLVVGDDFQSIYQFTGCNLDMFLNFKDFFKSAATFQITNTYRNSQELIKIAGDFIMKNKRQIRKNLKSQKSLKNPIELYYTNNPKNTLKKLLDKIDSKTILILGRNNHDILPFLDNELTYDKTTGKLSYLETDKEIRYLTIHKSKGLEADNVIIVNVVEGKFGIPSQVENPKVLNFILNSKEDYPFEEERRLFYVALTRTKNKVYILSNKNNPSRFIRELSHDLKYSTYNEM